MPDEYEKEFYSYLNLESTKTLEGSDGLYAKFYSYLNLESTKTSVISFFHLFSFIVT